MDKEYALLVANKTETVRQASALFFQRAQEGASHRVSQTREHCRHLERLFTMLLDGVRSWRSCNSCMIQLADSSFSPFKAKRRLLTLLLAAWLRSAMATEWFMRFLQCKLWQPLGSCVFLQCDAAGALRQPADFAGLGRAASQCLLGSFQPWTPQLAGILKRHATCSYHTFLYRKSILSPGEKSRLRRTHTGVDRTSVRRLGLLQRVATSWASRWGSTSQ